MIKVTLSVVFCSFFHQLNWPPRYTWNIVESGIKHHTKSSQETIFKNTANQVQELPLSPNYDRITNLTIIICNYRIPFQKDSIPQQRYIILFIYPQVASEYCRKEEVIRKRRRKHVHQKQMYIIHVLIIYTFKIATVMYNYLNVLSCLVYIVLSFQYITIILIQIMY